MVSIKSKIITITVKSKDGEPISDVSHSDTFKLNIDNLVNWAW